MIFFQSKFPDAPSGAALKSLMSPAAFQRSTATTTVKTDVDTLTKPQLQEALVYMIQVSSYSPSFFLSSKLNSVLYI